jgi:hypothetical protein
MPPFLQLHALAATRRDGLRPELRILLERLAAAPEAASSVAVPDGHLAELVDISPHDVDPRSRPAVWL